MIKVWTDGLEAGVLDRLEPRGSAFVYLPGAVQERAVSVTMPVRLPSWDVRFGLPPIFEMNLPEGALRERLRMAFAKATGTFDDLDLLSVSGRSQIGRIRYTGDRERLEEEMPFQSVDEILASRRGGDLFQHLMEKFAVFSGISGVQPKVLIRARTSFRGATHIVKFSDPNEFPHLAANEFFCLKAAERCGLVVPPHRIAEDGAALVVDRFDMREDGTYCGFEDFCVLNARTTDEKYRGSYETSIVKRFQQFAKSRDVHEDLEKLFTLIALNCALRNGDAHLKNFGILYDNVQGEARLAPVYDLVTTAVYLPNDRMALTLNGSTLWPNAKELRRFGETRTAVAPGRIRQILESISDALSETAIQVRGYMREHPAFEKVGAQMLESWDAGRHAGTDHHRN
jgi:serine/threonine-protein kinase HipA